mgnify:CR=1 FL=1
MRLKLVIALFASIALVACSGSKQVVVQQAPAKEPSADSVKKSRYPVKMDSAELLRLEIAHGSYLRALALQSQGEYSLAEQFMMHAYESDPENRYLAFSVLELMEMRGASSEAFALAEKAKKLKGKQTSNQYALLGRVYSEQSNLDSALAYYKKALDVSDQNLRAAYEYSLLLEIVHNYDELIRVYAILLPQIGYPQSMLERQISLLANAKKDSLMADLFGEVYESRGERIYLENQIRLLFGMKRFEEALSGIEEFRADSTFADDSLAVAFLTAAYVELKQDTVAVDSLKAIYKRHPDNHHVLMNLALLETKLGKKEQALVHWERLSSTDKYAASAFGMLSAYAQEGKDSTKALQYLEKAYEKEPLAFRSSLLVYYAKIRAYSKAYKVLDKAVVPNPKSDSIRAKIQESGNLEELRKFETAETMNLANAHYSYGTLLQMNAEDLERAPTTPEKVDSAKVLRKLADDHYMAASKIAGDTPNLLFAYASNLLMYDQVDSAITVFKKIFAKYPQDATAKNHLGYYLVDMNRSPDEVKWGNALIDEALKMEPSNIAYKDSKGWALYRLGKYKEALAIMEQVETAEDSLKELFYQDTSIYVHLAAICQALSLNDRALNYYQKVLNIDPKNENAKKQIEVLKQAIKEAETVQEEPAKAPAAEKDSGKAP